ncbi:MAG: hypothetical protein ACXWDL_10715, partial [Nocardioides sp.]
PQTRIEFSHAPLEDHARAGADGFYGLEPIDEGTRLSIELTITARLPLPGLARPAVQAAMHQVLNQMGNRFAANMLRELGDTR